MGIIIVNNQNIKKHFLNIIYSEKLLKIRKIMITSKSGKGKTSLLKYLVEQCRPNNIPVVYFDFKFIDLTSELDFLDQIIYNLKTFYESLEFKKYNNCINEFYNKCNNNIIIKNVKVTRSSIGNITTPNHITSSFMTKAASAFWEDYNDILAQTKIIFVFDSYEETSEEIRKWVNRFLLQRNLHRNQLYIVVASLEEVFEHTDIFFDDIKQYFLPDRYELEEWYKFGEEIHILDTSIIERCYSYYDGEPFRMCIALRPLGDFDED